MTNEQIEVYENTYKKLQQEAHAVAVDRGWWDKGDSRDPFEMLQLISTEVAEATEGERKDLMDDHLPHRKMGEVELADAAIRLLDMGGYFKWQIHFISHVAAFFDNYAKNMSIARQHFTVNIPLAQIYSILGWKSTVAEANELAKTTVHEEFHLHYSIALQLIYCIAEHNGYSLFETIQEKMEYNKVRKDHSREERAKANGKAF